MSTNLAVLRTGIYNTLTACGPYAAAQVSACDYRILEQNSGCSIVFHYGPEETNEPIAGRGGGLTHVEYNVIKFSGEIYLPFTGNSPEYLSRVYQARDDIKATVKKDSKLQGSACLAFISRITYNIDEGYSMAARDFGLLRFVIDIHDL